VLKNKNPYNPVGKVSNFWRCGRSDTEFWMKTGMILKTIKASFYSDSFTDGQWNKCLPWFEDFKVRLDWNTYGIFSQKYGKWYFKVKLDGLIQRTNPIQGTYVPAIWLLDMRKRGEGKSGIDLYTKGYYYEVDIELQEDGLHLSFWANDNGGQNDPGRIHKKSVFRIRELKRRLQREYHLFLIDWREDWLKFYINGILACCFKNEIHVPLQVIMTKLSMSKVIIQK
jgi:hypothetical protein